MIVFNGNFIDPPRPYLADLKSNSSNSYSYSISVSNRTADGVLDTL